MTFQVPEEIESLITAFVTRQKRIQSRSDELAVHSRAAHVAQETYHRRLALEGGRWMQGDSRDAKRWKVKGKAKEARFELDCVIYDANLSAEELLIELEKFTISNPGDAESLREAIADTLELIELLPEPLPEIIEEPVE